MYFKNDTKLLCDILNVINCHSGVVVKGLPIPQGVVGSENNPLVPEPPAARAGELGVAAGLGEAAWLSSVGFIGCNDDEQSLSSVVR